MSSIKRTKRDPGSTDRILFDRHDINLTEVEEFFKMGGPEGWRRRGVCNGMDPATFYPESGESPKDAQRVCSTCPLKKTCLLESLRTQEHYGVWGGLTERERRKLQRALGRKGIFAPAPASNSLDSFVNSLRVIFSESA